MSALRRFFFYLFLLVYLVAAPVAILYAFGYMWAPGSERGLVRSGLVALNTTPDDAQVFLGASRYTRRTPTLLRDLLPGEYSIRLARPGFEDLTVTARIEPDRATVLDRLLLLPTARSPRPILDETWTGFFAHAGGRYLLLQRGAAHFLYDTRKPDEPPRDISRLFTGIPDELAWSARDPDELFVRIGTRVHRLDLEDGAIYPDVTPPARRIAMAHKRLYIADEEGRPMRVARDGTTEPPGARIPPDFFAYGARAPIPNDAETRWLYADGNRLGALDREEMENGDWTWTNRVLYAHAEKISGAQWAHDDSHILFSDGSTLWLLALERGGGGPPRAVCRIGSRGVFHLDERSGRVWLLDSEGRLNYLALVPPRALLPLARAREEAP